MTWMRGVECAFVALDHSLSHVKWRLIEEQRVYYSLDPGDYVYLVSVKLIYLKGSLQWDASV
jgi:hypothetical protein